MNRNFFVVLGFASVLSLVSVDAQAQWGYGSYGLGYGGYGWGGWGSTVGGDMARGLGALYSGAGLYNQETAVANAINADTVMRFNEYLYESQLNSSRRYHQQQDALLAEDQAAYDALMKRLRESPNERDITNGDALNIALDQLGDPRIHSSALRMATDPVDAQLIRDIPFRNASEAVTITLSQFKSAAKWPAALREERFAADQQEFERLIDSARKQDEAGDVSTETLDQLHGVLDRIKSKLKAQPLNNRDQKNAENFIKAMRGLLRMIEMPDVRAVLDELRDMKTTSVGNLLAFMHTFNLRFGPADTPKQRMIYDKLYPIIDKTRDRILDEIKPPETAQAKKNDFQVNDFFSAMDPEDIARRNKKRQGAPRPNANSPTPAPNNDQ